MSINTTRSINRKQAEEVILDWLKNASNEELGDTIDVIWEKACFNCLVVPEGMEDDCAV